MKLDDWNQRWIDNRIGWHRGEVNQTLEKYFPSGERPSTFFPLCGKTLDMIWYISNLLIWIFFEPLISFHSRVAQKGCQVRGAEFSQLAIDQFFEENKIANKSENGFIHSTESSFDIALKQGDFFEYPDDHKFELIFDRGSMVAVNPKDREKYAQKIKTLLKSDGKVLLQAISR